MGNFKKGDFVVPLVEEGIRVLKVSDAKNALSCEVEHGWEIAAKCNYRLATNEEKEKHYVDYSQTI